MRTATSRRRVLKSTAAAAALAVTAAKPLRAATESDVLVLGAGLAGLRAAVDLEDQGVKVQVIEGRNRAGGRVLSMTNIAGNPEAGGTGIGAGYGRMIDSASRCVGRAVPPPTVATVNAGSVVLT